MRSLNGASGVSSSRNEMKSPLERPATLRQQVFDLVLAELKGGALAPGTRITEEGLARRLEVSRTPIREALGQLTRQGVLLLRAGGGYLVPSPTREEVEQLVAVRLLLEPIAVRMAATEYGNEQVERISRAIRNEQSAIASTHPAAFARANEEFRHAIFDHLANRVLSRQIAQFDSHLHFIRSVTLKSRALRREIVARQVNIRDALKSRQGKEAEALWRAYLQFTEMVLIQAVHDLRSSDPEQG
jgi:DNA-binding GntR family transcriptional regulator